mmetsp:Transcript_17169/g.32678  ORF Transcript_17169/g.32678 Transcript_17169/m.32678 type:complete len:650 (-) Transcript_17169:142-2091(-)
MEVEDHAPPSAVAGIPGSGSSREPTGTDRKSSTVDLNSEEISPLETALHSVVKVFCTSATPNFFVPWQIQPQMRSTSSGFVIEGRRIICNAHGITDQVFIRVRKHGDATKYRAKVLATGHDCDLALITVDEDEFWKDLKPLTFGDIPSLQASVIVVGYPKGGDCISVTKGVVSRVVVNTYSHSNQVLLTVQIDAAINSGNSGGPALQGNTVVGVAFEGLQKSQNIGYIIPCTVVRQFIRDVDRNGKFSGIPCVGLRWQKMENESLRKFLNIPNDNKGILITAIESLAPCAKVLKVDDVIRKIDSVDVAGDGTIFFRRGERLSHVHLISSRSPHDKVDFEIIREGKTMTVPVELAYSENLALVPVNLYDQLPSYYVYAGLVFTVLSRPYLRAWGSSWSKKAPSLLVEIAFYQMRETEDEEIVVLNQVLAAPVNTSYERVCYLPVVSVNGDKVQNLKHMVHLVEKAEKDNAPFIKFKLMRDKVLVVESKLAKEDSPDILKRNNIPHPKSPDLIDDEGRIRVEEEKKAKGAAAKSIGAIKNAKSIKEVAKIMSLQNSIESIAELIFEAMDEDGSDSIEVDEFTPIFEKEWGYSKEMIVDLFNSFDKDNSGSVSKTEFAKFLSTQFTETPLDTMAKMATSLVAAAKGLKKSSK